MAVDVGSAVGYLDLDISKFIANLNQANAEAQNKTKTIENTLGDGLKTVGDNITGAGKTLTKGLTVPIVGAGAAIVKTTADFDKSMSQVKAVSGATGEDFDALRNKAREMGATTKFSASDAADAMNYMAMAGWKTDDMLSGISGVMNLAAASGEDLATTSDIVTDALTAFGKSANDSGRLSDIMAAASSNANTNVSMLGESFKYVAPLAGAMKYSMEDTSVALGLMANAGVKASQGGTSLRTVLTNMLDPTDEVSKAMGDLGISLQNEDGSMKSLKEVMLDLRKGFGGLKMSQEDFENGILKLDEALANGEITQEDYNRQVDDWIKKTFTAEDALKAQTAASLSGKYGLSGLLAIVNASEEDFNKLANAVENSSQTFVKTADGAIIPMSEAIENGIGWVEEYNGEAEKMAAIMRDNLSGQLDILKSGLQELAISFGDIMMPAIRGFTDYVTDLVGKLNNLDENQKQMILTIGMVIAAVGPLLLIIGGVISGVAGLIKNFYTISEAITKVKSGFTLLQPAIAGISAPVLAVVAVIGILVAAFIKLWNTNENFRKKITEIFNQIKKTIADFSSEFKKRFELLKPILDAFINFFKNAWNQFCNFLAPIFINVFNLISNNLKSFLDIIIGILDIFIGIFTGDWEKVWDGVEKVFTSIWDMIVNTFETVSDTIQSIASGLFDVLSGFFDSLNNLFSDVISSIISAVTNWASEMSSKAYSVGSDFVNNITNFISELPTWFSNTFSDIINNLFNWIDSMGQAGSNAASNLFDSVTNGLASLPDAMWDVGTSIVDGVWNGIVDAKGHFLDNVWDFFVGIVDSVKNALGIGSPSKVFAKEVGDNIPSGAEMGIRRSMPAMIKNTIKDFNGMVDDVSDSIEPINIDSAMNIAKIKPSSISGIASDFIISNNGNGLFSEENLQLLADMLYTLFRDNPIVNNINVAMEDGDVFLDNERVGRKLAPVVSRVQATGSI